MKNEERKKEFFWYWFVNIPEIGNVTRKRLLERFFRPEALFLAEEKEYADLLSKRQLAALKSSKELSDVKDSFERMLEGGIRFLHWESPSYPEKLRRIYDPPLGLYVKGSLPQREKPMLAMVGSRRATEYGMSMANNFAGIFAENGIQVVSGLAAGIDAASHRGVLSKGGYTLGVLGGGIDTIYPRENFNLYMEMYQRGGVLSEYNRGIPNRPGLFPVRNRIISGLADGIFVLEAGSRSGSLITADQALEQGRDVYVLPGRITDRMSEGCNRLIAQGAYLVQKPEDILEPLLSQHEWKKERTDRSFCRGERHTDLFHEHHFETEEQKKIYELLDEKDPTSFDGILEKSGYAMLKLQYILLEMELRGMVCQLSQNNYIRREVYEL
ncbi:MAG: DNA-processing protein DprA [Eubacteriales bacterium]|nr:DNA-processing protein DprA [Eubacteriales bacterium]